MCFVNNNSSPINTKYVDLILFSFINDFLFISNNIFTCDNNIELLQIFNFCFAFIVIDKNG